MYIHECIYIYIYIYTHTILLTAFGTDMGNELAAAMGKLLSGDDNDNPDILHYFG